ncbi:F-box protein CPR1-like [Silene latifolia]|uniref:F-box protein CPR1-like n=1 Tax=Silene latifolia TaxID=37657 RepID=UPI003D77FB6E
MCVCKSWYALINDPDFIREFNRSSSAKQSNHMVIVWKTSLYMVGIRNSGETLKLDFLPNLDQRCYRITSCNGLLCIFDSMLNSILLGNPSTLSYQMLPGPKSFDIYKDWPKVRARYLGFGYDDKSDDYKVVRIVTFMQRYAHSTFMVYSLKSASWKQIEGLPSNYHFIRNNNSYNNRCDFNTCVNNSLHWIVVEKNPNQSTLIKTILKFDLTSEKISFVPVPTPAIRHQNSYTVDYEEIGALGSYLYYASRNKGYYNLWIMKEYNVKESWTKLVHFQSTNYWNMGYVRPVAYLEEEFKVTFVNGDVSFTIYDVLQHTFVSSKMEGLPRDGSKLRTVVTCVPKIIPLKKPHINSKFSSKRKQISNLRDDCLSPQKQMKLL